MAAKNSVNALSTANRRCQDFPRSPFMACSRCKIGSLTIQQNSLLARQREKHQVVRDSRGIARRKTAIAPTHLAVFPVAPSSATRESYAALSGSRQWARESESAHLWDRSYHFVIAMWRAKEAESCPREVLGNHL